LWLVNLKRVPEEYDRPLPNIKEKLSRESKRAMIHRIYRSEVVRLMVFGSTYVGTYQHIKWAGFEPDPIGAMKDDCR
jgi:hypothetical protein